MEKPISPHLKDPSRSDGERELLPCGCDPAGHPPHMVRSEGFFAFMYPPEKLNEMRRRRVPPPGLGLIQCSGCKLVLAVHPLLPDPAQVPRIIIP